MEYPPYKSLCISYDRKNNVLELAQTVMCTANASTKSAAVTVNESTPNPSDSRIQQQCGIKSFNCSSDNEIISHLSLSSGISLRRWLRFSLGCFTDGFLLHALVETEEPEEREGPVLRETTEILHQYEYLIVRAMTIHDSVDDCPYCEIINLFVYIHFILSII